MSNYNNIVVLTGAGISAESGLATFRAEDGLWENHPVDEVATPEGFARNPVLVHEFYNARRTKAQDVSPNPAHVALAEFERDHRGEFLLITQNVDDLHERAGSQNVVHMHGELLSMLCGHCDARWKETRATSPEDMCPICGETATRPDIVWFGEMPYEMERIWQALSNADLFVSIGTSGHVYPAAGFAQTAWRNGAKTMEINLEPSKNAADFDETHYGLAGEILPDIMRNMKETDDYRTS